MCGGVWAGAAAPTRVELRRAVTGPRGLRGRHRPPLAWPAACTPPAAAAAGCAPSTAAQPRQMTRSSTCLRHPPPRLSLAPCGLWRCRRLLLLLLARRGNLPGRSRRARDGFGGFLFFRGGIPCSRGASGCEMSGSGPGTSLPRRSFRQELQPPSRRLKTDRSGLACQKPAPGTPGGLRGLGAG